RPQPWQGCALPAEPRPRAGTEVPGWTAYQGVPTTRTGVASSRSNRFEGSGHDAQGFGVESDSEGGLAAGGGHLAEGLGDDVDHVVLAELSREVGELRLDEDKAQRVLERLDFRVGAQAFLLHQRLHSLDRGLVVTDVPQDRPNHIGVMLLQPPLPLQVAGA